MKVELIITPSHVKAKILDGYRAGELLRNTAMDIPARWLDETSARNWLSAVGFEVVDSKGNETE